MITIANEEEVRLLILKSTLKQHAEQETKGLGQNAIIGEVKKEVVCSESFCLQEIDAENVGIGYTNFTSGFQLKVFRKTTVTALCGYFDVDFSKNASYNVSIDC